MAIFRGVGGAGDSTTDATLTAVTQQAAYAIDAAERAEAAALAAAASAAESGSSEDAAAASAAAAAASEAAAAASEAAAALSEAAAASSETNAAASELAAAASEAAAAASEAAAAASEAAAAVSEANAAASETAAATSEANAATSETNAAASEAAAAASESAAATSESNAATSETNAAASAAAAAASFDDFDDRYLGAKSADPTVDNDGNPLIVGALYWSSTADEFRAWDGAAWQGFGGLPSQDGASGKYLKSDGANADWSAITVDEVVPDQTGNSGKFLTTDGTNATWGVVPDPQPATPTDDGLVFGYTDSYGSLPTASSVYWATATENDVLYLVGKASSPVSSSNLNYDGPGVGFHIYLDQYDGGVFVRTIDLGTVTSLYTDTSGIIGAVTDLSVNLGVYKPSAFENVGGTVRVAPDVSLGGNASLGYGSNDNGSGNTTVGYGAGSTITTGSNLTVVGYDAEPSAADATNEATLGNASTTKTRLWGAIAVDDDTGTSGQVLTSNGTGSATWETPAAAPVTSVNGYTGTVVLAASDVGAATSSDIDTAIANLVDTAPATLDTLNELAAALGDDPNFATTVTNSLATKAPLTDPTFTGTVTADFLVGDGSGITGIDSFPAQTGHSGEYLTTDGTNVSWGVVDALPDQTGNSGKYLTTDGTNPSWAVLDTDANTTTKGLYEMANTISTNYTIGTGNNAVSAGPITVASGATVTVPSGSRWVIV